MGIATTEDRGQRSKDPDPGSLSLPSCHVERLTEPWHLEGEPGTLGTGGTLGCTGHPRHAGYPPLRKSSTALLFLRQTPGHRSLYVPYQSSPFLCHHFMSS